MMDRITALIFEEGSVGVFLLVTVALGGGGAWLTGGANDVAEIDVLAFLSDQLDPPRAIGEVEESELAHVTPRHHAPGDPV